MSLKSEIVVDKVKPLGGQFDIHGIISVYKPDNDSTPIFEINPTTGTISNSDFTLGHNDLDIPVFTFKDKSGFSILTDQTTENLSGKLDPNKGIKLQSNPAIEENRITIGNLTDGAIIPSNVRDPLALPPGQYFGNGSITINSSDLENYKGIKDSIRLKSSNTIIEDISGSAAFIVTETFNKDQKHPFSNIIIGTSNTSKGQIYTGTNSKYNGSTSFLGSGSRTIVKNNLLENCLWEE